MASRSKVAKTSSTGASRSSSITSRISSKLTLGAASRRIASFAWKRSRCSGGTIPRSTKESTWPSFIAAPFMPPSTVTICSAASSCRRSIAASARSSERVMLAVRVPACLTAWPAAAAPTRANRPSRPVGTRSATLPTGP